jgi:hypothetical protein
MAEELHEIIALTVAAATMLAFAFPWTPRALAQGHDDGAGGFLPGISISGTPALCVTLAKQEAQGREARSNPQRQLLRHGSDRNCGKIPH